MSHVRDEVQAFKRDRIVQEAVALFYERGFVATTLDDIAAKLGVTKPFIYTHFKSKTDLLAAICKPTIQLSVAAIADAVAGPGSPTEQLQRAMQDFTRVIVIRQANIAIFFREEKHLEPDALGEINALRKQFDHLLSGLLELGVARGEFTVADTRLAALAIGGMISWAYTWYRPGGRLDDAALAGEMAELAMRMAGIRISSRTNA